MTEAGDKLLAGAREAAAVARGEVPAARIYHQGHAYVPEQQWQPIETAPKDGTDILVWDGDSVSLSHWDEGWWVLLEYTLDGVTHWQPLPPPPLT